MLIRRLFQFTIRHRGLIGIVLLLHIFLLPIPFFNALLTQYLIDKVILPRDFNLFLQVITIVLLIVLSIAGLELLSTFLSVILVQNIRKNILYSYLANLLTKKLSFFQSVPSGHLIYSFFNDTQALGESVSTLWINAFLNLIMVFIILTVLLHYHVGLALVTIAVVPIQVILVFKLRPLIIKRLEELKSQDESLTHLLQSMLTNIDSIKSFCAENQELLIGKHKISERMKTDRSRLLLIKYTDTSVKLLTAILSILLLGYGSFLVLNNTLTLGQALAFITLSAYLYPYGAGLVGIFVDFQDVKVKIKRFFGYYDTSQEIINIAKNRAERKQHFDKILLNKIVAGYNPTQPILRNVTWEIKPGIIYLIQGESGIGKSTLVKLLPRLIDPLSGSIQIDGADYLQIELSWLRHLVCYLPTRPHCIGGTVIENICYGSRKPIDKKGLYQTAQISRASNFIEKLPNKYESLLLYGGSNLSEGERQRLAVARALYYEPHVLIIDEALSSVDAEMEYNILDEIKKKIENITLIIISHRNTALELSDYILRIERDRTVSIKKVNKQ